MGTRYDHGGGAVDTTLSGDITAGDTAATIGDATGWPSGGGNGEFWVAIGVIDPTSRQFTSNVEKVKVGSRTGTTLSSVVRGQDGTTATAHSAGETVRHIHSAAEVHQASEHAGNTSVDDHTQYHTAARHAAVSHTQAMMGADSVGAAQIIAGAVGSAELASGAVVAGKIATGGISAAAQFAAGVVDSAAIAADAVGSPELADAAIDTVSHFATGLSPWIVAAGDPGAVGANRFWMNTTKRALLVRNAANTAWEVVLTLGAGVNYTPTLYNFSVGTAPFGGYNYARYRRFGTTVLADGFCRFGGDAPAISGRMAVGLPVAAANLSSSFAHEFFYHGAARASNSGSGPGVYAGVGVIGVGTVTNAPDRLDFFATAGISAGWNATTPFTWSGQDNDRFSWFCEYETASAEDANFV